MPFRLHLHIHTSNTATGKHKIRTYNCGANPPSTSNPARATPGEPAIKPLERACPLSAYASTPPLNVPRKSHRRPLDTGHTNAVTTGKPDRFEWHVFFPYRPPPLHADTPREAFKQNLRAKMRHWQQIHDRWTRCNASSWREHDEEERESEKRSIEAEARRWEDMERGVLPSYKEVVGGRDAGGA